jgi:hypothetical protein
VAVVAPVGNIVPVGPARVWGAGVVLVATETSVVVDLDVLMGDMRCNGFMLVLSTTMPAAVPSLQSDTW